MANLLTSYSAPKEAHQRTHRYVYWHCRDQLWQVKVGGKVLGSFADHADALAVAVKKAGLSQTQLHLHPHDVRKSSQGKTRSKQHGSGMYTEPTQEYMDQPILATTMTCISGHTVARKSSHTLTS